MDILYARKACCTKLLSGLFLIFLLVFMPFNLWAQTAVPQPCVGNIHSWIARWTLSTTGPFVPYKMTDGDINTCEDAAMPGPWVFNIDFGILRRLSGIKLYSREGLYSPHAYQIFVSQDNLTFSFVISGNLPYRSGAFDTPIDFNGYVDAKYVRIVIADAYQTPTIFSNFRLRIWECNFFQCGVDPLIAKQIAPGVVIAPSLSCADAVSKDIQGTINTYFPGLVNANKGASTVDVDMNHVRGSTHTLAPGDRVLIIQMQNALISEDNTMAYGDGVNNDLIASGWKDVRNTGEYEFAIVGSNSGNTIQLTQPLQKSYSADGVFQVVYSPVYDNVTLTGLVDAYEWDGYCGGIVTFDARTLNLNNQTIDVSSQGFRKGKKNSNTVTIPYYWGVYCTDNDQYFGEKGEGIAGAPKGSYSGMSKRLYSPENISTKSGGSFGRGAPGNAGGSGVSHNSGGGGGANIGSGGQGGASYGGNNVSGDMTRYWANTSTNGMTYADMNLGYYPNGGMGGTGSGAPDPFRIWMGGAGGGGHQNNDAASGGSNGGGIILATARVVRGIGHFYADGVSAGNSGNDGAGGGGAGGTIVFGFNDQSGATITYSAKGGNGGSVTAPDVHGPAGGGGGGAIIVSELSAAMNIKGGMNGVHIASGSQWGANKGQDGKAVKADNLSALFTYSCDHGDAPVSFGDAAHQIKPNATLLGTLEDSEPMALNQPPHDRDAKGDDLNGLQDDDGVELPFDTTFSTGQSSLMIKVFVNNPKNENVNVCGWIDFNGNGLFEDKEKISIWGKLTGPNVLTWNNIPTDITGGDSYARFRISTGTEALQPTGVAPDGEVEDYLIHINAQPQALPDDTCTHQDRPVNILVVKNDDIHGDKRGYITIQTPLANGTAVINDNNTLDDKTDDYITYTPKPGFQGTEIFYYEIWNAIGNSAKAKVTVTVKEPISVDFIANPNEGCTPMAVKFTNQSSDLTAGFTWDFGDNSPLSPDINPEHTFTTTDVTTIDTVKLTMNTGCGIITTYKLITVHPLPVAVMTESSNEDKPEQVKFEDVTIGSIRRIWEEDGMQLAETGKILTRTYEHAGPYTIKLIAYNAFDCPNETVLVHQTVFRDLYVPNAFMPNSTDLLVKKFIPVGYGLSDYSLMIFDLWGNFIWSTTGILDKRPRDGWDGTKNGQPLPNDVYIWRIHAVFENGKVWKGMQSYKNGQLEGSFHTQGTVTIIR